MKNFTMEATKDFLNFIIRPILDLCGYSFEYKIEKRGGKENQPIFTQKRISLSFPS